MTTYTHDNGIIVTRSEDGRIYFNEGIRSTFLAADEAAAIHAAFLHSLGLALWEHDGERWLILPCGTTPTLVHVADRDPSTYRRAES